MIIEALIVAGAILIASAALIYFRNQTDDIRAMARTLVRATEKRGEWDETINSEHIKRARVALVLQDKWPELDNEWISIIIEEAVFDMEADRGQDSISSTRAGSDIRQYDGHVGDESGATRSSDHGDNWDSGDRAASDSGDSFGRPNFEVEPEDLEIPSSD
jgi:hypothetical protein